MIRVSEAVLPGHPDKLCDFRLPAAKLLLDESLPRRLGRLWAGTSHFRTFRPDSPAEGPPRLQDNWPNRGPTCHARRREP